MELEKLNSTQIVLLTLLVSFVTSIATGIATVSLMENAPADVTRVISRIIEQPIQTITPGSTVTETVVVSEGELIADAVAKALPSVVRIYEETRSDLAFKGFGVIMTTEGRIITDADPFKVGEEYVVALNNGAQVSAEATDESGAFAFIQLQPNEGAALDALTPASFAPYDALSLGQSVISIGGGANASISAGIISELIAPSGETPLIRAGVQSAQLSAGSPLLDTRGRVVGLLADAGERTFNPVVLASPVDAE